MPRVVPSDVVRMIDRLFPDMASNPRAFPQVGLDARPPISALVRLIEAVPESLLVLTPERYAPDEAPAEDTVELAFISDPELRESIVSTSARPTATWLTASGKG
jgi:hypothetical protein